MGHWATAMLRAKKTVLCTQRTTCASSWRTNKQTKRTAGCRPWLPDLDWLLGFIHPLQNVALHQCLPLSSVCCFPVPVIPPFRVISSCYLLFGRPFDIFLGCRSVQRLVHLHSCYMSSPSPLLLQCVFYNANYLCSFSDLCAWYLTL